MGEISTTFCGPEVSSDADGCIEQQVGDRGEQPYSKTVDEGIEKPRKGCLLVRDLVVFDAPVVKDILISFQFFLKLTCITVFYAFM